MPKVLFNSVLTTANGKETKVILKDEQMGLNIYPYQEVLQVGASVQEIKPGDIVHIKTENFKESPSIEIDGKLYLLISERDIKFIYEKEELESLFLNKID